MKSIFSSRRNKSPHNNEADKQGAPFFGKENKVPFFHSSSEGAVQTKLTVGQPGDKYEKEADSMADAVVNNSASKPDVQNKEFSTIQRESLATPQEDEKLGTAERRIEEDKLVQEKPEIQKVEELEEEGMINKMESEEEEELLQTKGDGTARTASTGVSQKIKSKSGKGKSLPKKTRAEMEASFGSDFSGVNIHTDNDAITMNKELGAQAFTNGRDVYFNSGKYNPDSTEGKRLLAHELTHVLQQDQDKIAPKIQRMIPCPSSLQANDPIPRGFKRYQGNSSWFHCGYRGILEDRAPSPQDPQNECFYDTLGRLVDRNHENSGCMGTPNDYDSSASWWDHTFNDRGGIWERGWDAFWSSRFSNEDRTGEEQRDAQEACVVRLGGCPQSRPAGIPTPEEIEEYNNSCRSESGHRGSNITPNCD